MNEEMVRCIESGVEPRIRHIRTQKEYFAIGFSKAKFNGKWYDGVTYVEPGYCNPKPEVFWRMLSDFSGFELANK